MCNLQTVAVYLKRPTCSVLFDVAINMLKHFDLREIEIWSSVRTH